MLSPSAYAMYRMRLDREPLVVSGVRACALRTETVWWPGWEQSCVEA